MAPTARAAALVAVAALSALVAPAWVAAIAVLVVAGVVVADALSVRTPPRVDREVAAVQSRGVGSRVVVRVAAAGRARVRQPVPPDLFLDPDERDQGLLATVTPMRRGRHSVPPVAVRVTGRLGLGAWYHQRCGEATEVTVYPDLPAARTLAMAVRQGRFRDAGHLTRGPLGLGTDFETIREYQPDDDVRQINWSATRRTGRPMSNQYRIEQDREVICVVDTGRLMGAPLGDRTRLDAAVDAVAAVALVADEVGDRCGVVAFDDAIRRSVRPRRNGGDAVVRAVFDLEPTPVESDHELAFRTVGGLKRALVIVLTDLLEESAARPLVDAVPVLARRHAVVVATATDTDLARIVEREPRQPHDVYEAAVAVDVLAARARAAALLRRVGADVVEARPEALGAACVRAYLRAKARARL
ncbi:MAG TPA: DUF58 domain-containing protein [Actinomycetota bacterium]|nr:DUF58 domain-containing protein [Actinomycetota bacterium]